YARARRLDFGLLARKQQPHHVDHQVRRFERPHGQLVAYQRVAPCTPTAFFWPRRTFKLNVVAPRLCAAAMNAFAFSCHSSSAVRMTTVSSGVTLQSFSSSMNRFKTSASIFNCGSFSIVGWWSQECRRAHA